MRTEKSTSTAKQSAVANSLLQALPRKECRHMLARCEQVSLTYGDILNEPGEHIRHVYFPNTGLISLLTPVDGHASVEVGMVGSEGMAGGAAGVGIKVFPGGAPVEGCGTAPRG